MILLDTNVVSEPLKPTPSTAVVAWLDAQPVETLFLSTISLAELRFGVAALPDGRRKTNLSAALEDRLVALFSTRLLAFDALAASAYARIRIHARAAGKAIGASDGYIAAIAAARGLLVATRDTAPFEAAGLGIVNPWQVDASQ